MLAFSLIIALAASAGLCMWRSNKRMTRHIHELERDLQVLSDVVTQVAEVQLKTFEKHSAGIESLEERIMELSVPSHDSTLPLERRHQVLALSRQGIPLEDIVKRLKAPVGEAELILNLRKYMGGTAARPTKMNEQVRKYA